MAIQSLEAFDAEYAAKRAKLVLEHEIALALDNEPNTITIVGGLVPAWISYEVETLDDIIVRLEALAGKHAFLPVDAIENGCLSIQPVGHHTKEYAGKTPRWTVTECIELRQNGGKGFRADEVSVWIALGERTLKVSFKFAYRSAGLPWKLRSTVSAHYGTDGDVISSKLNEVPLRADARVNFGGGSRDSLDLRYYFAGIDNFKAAVVPQEEAA